MIQLNNQNQQLLQKYKTDQSFHKKMNRISLKFQQYQQLAVYKEFTESSKVLASIQKNDEESWSINKLNRINLSVIIGKRQPTGSKCIENLLLSIIKYCPRPTQPYSFIYINTLANSDAYSDFKKVLDFLPIQYLSFLHKIYVLQASFLSKAFDLLSFDYILNYFKNKTAYIDSVQELIKIIGLKPSNLLTKLPSQISKQLTKGSKIMSENMQNPSTTPILKIPLKQKQLEEYQVGQTGAPLIIELLIYYFNEHQEYLDLQGLFRKSANIEEETLLLKELQRQNYDFLCTVTDPHLVANAIKRFLSNLAQPIVPYDHFNTLMLCQDNLLSNQIVKAINSLPNNRKITLFILVDFFREKLLPRTNCNQMNQENLSIVIGPCLMKSQAASLKDLMYASKIVNVMRTIFKSFQIIFGSKKQRMNLIRCSVLQHQGEILKERLGGLQQQYLWLTQFKLTQQQQQNLDEADQFLSAFHKK